MQRSEVQQWCSGTTWQIYTNLYTSTLHWLVQLSTVVYRVVVVQWRYSDGTVALNGTECSAVQRSEMQCSYGVHSAVQ